MYKKLCKHCKNTSFSSTKIDRWQCPHCMYDIGGEKAYIVDHSMDIKLIKQRLDQFRGLEIYKNISS